MAWGSACQWRWVADVKQHWEVGAVWADSDEKAVFMPGAIVTPWMPCLGWNMVNVRAVPKSTTMQGVGPFEVVCKALATRSVPISLTWGWGRRAFQISRTNNIGPIAWMMADEICHSEKWGTTEEMVTCWISPEWNFHSKGGSTSHLVVQGRLVILGFIPGINALGIVLVQGNDHVAVA